MAGNNRLVHNQRRANRYRAKNKSKIVEIPPKLTQEMTEYRELEDRSHNYTLYQKQAPLVETETLEDGGSQNQDATPHADMPYQELLTIFVCSNHRIVPKLVYL